MRKNPFILLSLTLFMFAASHADEPNPGIQLGSVGYAGSGCPLGSLGLALSPDARSLSIAFSEFEAKVEGGSSNRVIRKSCDLAIPVHVPAGYSVLPTNGGFAGSYQLAENSLVRINVVRAWSGAENARERIVFEGAADSIFDIELAPHTELWSPCGRDALLRYSFGVYLEARDSTTGSSVRIDTVRGGPDEISFRWRKCS